MENFKVIGNDFFSRDINEEMIVFVRGDQEERRKGHFHHFLRLLILLFSVGEFGGEIPLFIIIISGRSMGDEDVSTARSPFSLDDHSKTNFGLTIFISIAKQVFHSEK